VKTIDDFIEEVTKCYASLIAYGRWADCSPYSEDEAWSKAFLGTAQTYRKEVKTDVHLRDSVVVAGRGRCDEAVQALDKGEDKMRDLLPGAAKDRAFSDRCVILLIRLVAQLKLVHRSTEYLKVWEHFQRCFGNYHGPTYTKEYEEALAHVEKKVDQHAYGLGLATVKKEGGWTDEFKDEVYGLVKYVVKEMGLDSRTFIDTEQACRLIQAWQRNHPLAEEDILRIRCTQHHQVPQMNSAAAGAECGVCVINTAMETLRMQAKEKGPLVDKDKFMKP